MFLHYSRCLGRALGLELQGRGLWGPGSGAQRQVGGLLTTALIKGLTERNEQRKPDTPRKWVLAMDDSACVIK